MLALVLVMLIVMVMAMVKINRTKGESTAMEPYKRPFEQQVVRVTENI